MTPEIKRLNRYLARVEENAESIRERILHLTQAEERRRENELKETSAKLKAKKLARENSITIDDEQREFDRLSVWPPVVLSGDNDRHDCDHYVYSWVEALKRVQDYVTDIKKHAN